MDFGKKIWTTKIRETVIDTMKHNLMIMDDIIKGLEIVRRYCWDQLPDYLRDGWWHHKKDIEDIIHNHTKMFHSVIYHAIRRARLFVRAIILLGHISAFQLPIGSYDDPSSPLPIPTLYPEHEMREDTMMDELILPPPANQDLYE